MWEIKFARKQAYVEQYLWAKDLIFMPILVHMYQ